MADTQPAHTRESLIALVQALAAEHGRRRILLNEFQRETGIPTFQIVKLFGTYTAFLEAAGLTTAKNTRLTDDELMRALRDACVSRGGIVAGNDLSRLDGYRIGAYKRRWGNWRHILLALRKWVDQHDTGFAYRAGLPKPNDKTPLVQLRRVVLPARYGAPINFRGILHEPVNEAGVIMLFGILAEELGFAVERVTASFPDCETKRRTSDGWQRARVEFEFESRNFEKHGHDPDGCDLIVCWQHNWPEAPVAVLELKAEVEKRTAKA